MNAATMPHDIVMRDDELLQRRVDVVEVDVGDEAVESGVDAGRLVAMDVAVCRNQVRDRSEIGEPARDCSVRIKTPDPLIIIALGVELLRRHQPFVRELRVLALQRIANAGQ